MVISDSDYANIYVIGDLHGHLAPLQRLLSSVGPKDGDLVVFIGDYIDRGPDSYLLVQELVEMKKQRANTLFLRGNHEDMMLGSLGYPAVVRDIRTWLYNGGGATLTSYGMEVSLINSLTTMKARDSRKIMGSHIPQPHIDFMTSAELYIETERYFICHAGIDPTLSIREGKEREEDLLWMRDHLSVGDEPGMKSWDKTVVCGHTPLSEVLFEHRLICLDTGLHYGGKLSAVEIFTGRVFSVTLTM